MNGRRLGDRLIVAGQPEAVDVAGLAQDGVRLVVGARPDGEEPGQPTAASIGAAASEAGIGYVHLPVRMGAIGRAEVDTFGTALRGADGVVFAHCKSGTRAAVLWGLDRVLNEGAELEETEAKVRAAGFDPSAMRAALGRM